MTAKLIFIVNREQPDPKPIVVLLCTSVSKSDEDDWNGLFRLLGFMKGKINNKHIIGAAGMTDLWTWVDAAYSLHEDM